MPKWRKDAKEFEVGVNYAEGRGYSSSIPKPIIDILDHPKKIKFIVKDEAIEITSLKTSTDTVSKKNRGEK